jgi:hypothetical protein
MDSPGAPEHSPTTGTRGNALSYAAIALGIVAVFIAPIIVGPIGIVLAVVARSKGEPRWTWGLGVAIAGTVIGLILGAMVAQEVMS